MAAGQSNLFIGKSTRGGKGVFAPQRYFARRGAVIGTFGAVMLKPLSWVIEKAPWWRPYALDVPLGQARALGVSLAEGDSPWVLIPRAHNRSIYVYGKGGPRAHLVDATNLGFMFNTRVGGEEAHATWRITYEKGTWGASVVAARDIYSRSKHGMELLIDYGKEYLECIEARVKRAALVRGGAPPARGKTNKVTVCGTCKAVVASKRFIAHAHLCGRS